MTRVDPESPPRPRPWTGAALGLSALAIALSVLGWASAYHVQDDAYMFVRYAERFLADGVWSWNPGQEPTYGATSLGYLAFVTAFRGLVPDQSPVAIAVCSAIWGVVFLALAARILSGSGGRVGGRAALVLGFLLLALAGRNLAPHFVNGMDTTLSMSATAVLVLLWRRWERQPTRGATAALVAGGAAACVVRPDLAVFALGVPLVVLVLTRGPARRLALVVVAGVAAAIAATAACAWAVFDSPVPLSFYAKGLGRVYSETFVARYAHMPSYQLRLFGLAYSPLLAAVAVDFLRAPRRWWREAQPATLGLLAAGLVFVAYYRLFVVQVVPFHQRFYYPVLPVVLALGGRSVARIAEDVAASTRARALPRLLAPLAALIGLLPVGFAAERIRSELHEGIVFEFDILERYRRRGSRMWVGLDQMRALPTTWSLATTEVGHPAVMLPDVAVVDLAGLNETRIARQGFDAEWLLQERAPDLIYMPHPHYDQLEAALLSSDTFARDYEHFPREQLGSIMGVALRRAGAHYDVLRRIVLAEPPDQALPLE